MNGNIPWSEIPLGGQIGMIITAVLCLMVMGAIFTIVIGPKNMTRLTNIFRKR